MELTAPERRILRIISQNIILSSEGETDDVVDPSTGKRVVPKETADRLIDAGLAEWVMEDAYEEYRLVLTEAGRREAETDRSEA